MPRARNFRWQPSMLHTAPGDGAARSRVTVPCRNQLRQSRDLCGRPQSETADPGHGCTWFWKLVFPPGSVTRRLLSERAPEGAGNQVLLFVTQWRRLLDEELDP